MTQEQTAAMVNVRTARALIRAMGMQAENEIRKHRGEYPAYSEVEFLNVIDSEGIGHNEVATLLRE